LHACVVAFVFAVVVIVVSASVALSEDLGTYFFDVG
jgi:hypothetical protein